MQHESSRRLTVFVVIVRVDGCYSKAIDSVELEVGHFVGQNVRWYVGIDCPPVLLALLFVLNLEEEYAHTATGVRHIPANHHRVIAQLANFGSSWWYHLLVFVMVMMMMLMGLGMFSLFQILFIIALVLFLSLLLPVRMWKVKFFLAQSIVMWLAANIVPIGLFIVVTCCGLWKVISITMMMFVVMMVVVAVLGMILLLMVSIILGGHHLHVIVHHRLCSKVDSLN